MAKSDFTQHALGRRDFLSVIGLGAVACALPHAANSAERRRKPPNIVLILADDMGFGDLACQNPDSKIPTPNLDRMASEGMRFTDAHSPSAVCTPTRYGILTGRYCWRTHLKESVLWAWDPPLIEPDRLTLPAMLKQQGYTTACIGKWHLGWDWPATDGSKMSDVLAPGKWDNKKREPFGEKVDFTQPIGGGPTSRGFDYYFGDDVPNFPPYCFIENDRVLQQPTEVKPAGMFGAPGPMAPGWDLTAVMPALTERAAEYIRAEPGAAPFHKPKDAPFFLYFPLTAPHTPIAPIERFHGKSEAGRYGDFVHEVDWTVGEVMRALEETGQADNTLLIFTSDNGSPARDGTHMAGQPRSVLRYGHNPSHIYRGIKADIWEGGHRVPFLVRWPGHVPAGATSDQLLCGIDIMATCAAITGADLPEKAAEDSYNMLDAFAAEAGGPIREALVHHSINGMFSIRQGRWKLVEGRGSGGWTKTDTEDAPPGQLYDMQTDPEEEENLYETYPEVVQRLQALLDRYKRDGRSAPQRVSRSATE